MVRNSRAVSAGRGGRLWDGFTERGELVLGLKMMYKYDTFANKEKV